MFGKKKADSRKDGCKCTTKNCSNSAESTKNCSNSAEKTKNCHNTKASNMTSGSRSTKSCGAKTANSTKSCKDLSNANTKSCAAKSTAKAEK